MSSIKGFSKLSKEAKIEWIVSNYLNNDAEAIDFLKSPNFLKNYLSDACVSKLGQNWP
jgi:ribosomal protein S18